MFKTRMWYLKIVVSLSYFLYSDFSIPLFYIQPISDIVNFAKVGYGLKSSMKHAFNRKTSEKNQMFINIHWATADKPNL